MPKRKRTDNPAGFAEKVDLDGWVPSFRAGQYPQGTFTEGDLQAIAESYDPDASHDAPATTDHSKQGGPSFGWAEQVRVCPTDPTLLEVKFRDVDPTFRDAVARGRYEKRSVEIYKNFNGSGRPYLRAVTFLGATPPQVKGLPNRSPAFSFAEGEDPHGEFGMFSYCGCAGECTCAPYEPIDLRAEVAEIEDGETLGNIRWKFENAVSRVMLANDLDVDQKRAEISRLAGELKDMVGSDSDLFEEEAMPDPKKPAAAPATATPPAAAAPADDKEKDSPRVAQLSEQNEAMRLELTAARKSLEELTSEFADQKRAARMDKIVRFADEAKKYGLTQAHIDSGVLLFMDSISGVKFSRQVKGKEEREEVNALDFFQEFVKTIRPAPVVGRIAGPGSQRSQARDADVVEVQVFSEDGQPAGAERLQIPEGSSPESVAFLEKAARLASERHISFEEASRQLDREGGYYAQD